MHRFKDLEIWKQSRIFCKEIYKLIVKFLERETHLLIANDLGFLNDEDLKHSLKSLESIVKMTSKFKSSLK